MKILPGTNVTVRTDESIDVERKGNRVYIATVLGDHPNPANEGHLKTGQRN